LVLRSVVWVFMDHATVKVVGVFVRFLCATSAVLPLTDGTRY
jgi:hypothetical protein